MKRCQNVVTFDKKCYKYMEHLKEKYVRKETKSKKYSPLITALQISLAYIIAGISGYSI